MCEREGEEESLSASTQRKQKGNSELIIVFCFHKSNQGKL